MSGWNGEFCETGVITMENLEDCVFFTKFRLTKESVQFIYNRIEHSLVVRLRRGVPAPPILQLLGALRFYATGSFQSVVAELFRVSQSSISRITKRVSNAIAAMCEEFIKFPDRDGITTQKQAFMRISGFPGVIGAIDCSHVKIQSPGGPNAELFRNRKGYFSLNVQAVCDADLKFTNIVARWPGSVHDSRIFNSSRLCGQMENGDHQGILLGDSGYALKPYMMTPLSTPNTVPERRYNVSHCSTRNTVERMFGIWKRRFPCLSLGLRLKLETIVVVVIATAVLHNIARLHGDGESDGSDDDDGHDEDEPGHNIAPLQRRRDRMVVAVRNTIIQQNFTTD